MGKLLLEKGSKVRIVIETIIEELEDHTDSVRYESNQGLFGKTPFYYIKYSDGFSIELPTYHVNGTTITVHQADDPELNQPAPTQQTK